MTEQPEQLMFHGREITMTDSEKAAMRHKLLAHTIAQPSRAAAVPTSWVRRHAFVASSLVVLIALGATGVSANMAKPDDLLYNFRLQVNDRIESAIVFDDEAQLDVELRQIERQLHAEETAAHETLADEAADVVEQGTPTPEVSETPRAQELNLFEHIKNNLKARLGSGRTSDSKNARVNNDTAQQHIDDGLDTELNQMERELQREESTKIELED